MTNGLDVYLSGFTSNYLNLYYASLQYISYTKSSLYLVAELDLILGLKVGLAKGGIPKTPLESKILKKSIENLGHLLVLRLLVRYR